MSKVLLGMSGGVDSCASAVLLLKAGYEVEGVTLSLWKNDRVRDEKAVEDAKNAAKILGIAHRVEDASALFDEKVVESFVSEYMNCRTPNPCNLCNRYVKWEAMLRLADETGADYIATGHYAKKVQLKNGRFSLKADGKKDQTYALCFLLQEQLQRTLFPLGGYTKDEARALVRAAGLPLSEKKDSQEICFIPDDDYAGYIIERTGIVPEKGFFVDTEGKILGEHKGLIHYTVGQRRGLSLPMGRRVFVLQLDKAKNEVVIGDNEDLFTDTVFASGMNYSGIKGLADGESIRLFGKIRYAAPPVQCTVTGCGKDRIKAVFDTPVRAASPGQSLVLYEKTDEGLCLAAGGFIDDRREI